jgi:hypothetical protein
VASTPLPFDFVWVTMGAALPGEEAKKGESDVIPYIEIALCWILGSNLSVDTYSSEYHQGGDITGGFCPGAVSPPATSRYRGSVRIISEAPLVCPTGC